ncbi:MAG: cell division protein FtsA [Candidatus Harrisonbacteria bacterium RIFCSPHIGHO2_01_FULL_44_13]|uniref:Cell division protein FtsA n=1 Tax=Candidatus Harrisonbacteria bacterium RIFCSPLOWO2_01_FULL_44_18 TaxID=1798407 RepID=A0A1G1ZPD3_9BACT|nr:MAG: cell division protein FtsA [Candidatus Harrisonbacteria bacterium RIFCSPHIGHO2_01_FULL_44_13]OGY66289.1 MAG: cell division protein FtsA [Candidatus Harrisonbacteria bacterium RIFCSPLOWO2_01_FULL_44_18]
MNNFIVGLDIGSLTIKAAIGEIKRDGKLSLIQVFKVPSQGIRRGAVDDLADATRSINLALAELKKISKDAVKNIFVSIGNADARVQNSRGIVAVSRADYEICRDDIDRVIQASRAVNLPPNRMVVHAITREFIVDGVGDIRDPLGMVGNRLEVNSLIIDAFSPAVKNLTKCVEVAGGIIGGLIFAPMAGSRAVLSRNQKELGVALLDIGFGKTSLSVYEENKLINAKVFPIGASNVTNDLAIGLKTSVEVAETVKFSFGSALSKEVGVRETVELKKFDPRSRGVVSRRFISEIIEVRLAEIFEFVNNELKHIGKAARLPGGVVLIGGGAKIPGIADLARQELRLSTQIGIPDISNFSISSGELGLQVEDPELVGALGLLLWGVDKVNENKNDDKLVSGIFKKIVSSFLP